MGIFLLWATWAHEYMAVFVKIDRHCMLRCFNPFKPTWLPAKFAPGTTVFSMIKFSVTLHGGLSNNSNSKIQTHTSRHFLKAE